MYGWQKLKLVHKLIINCVIQKNCFASVKIEKLFNLSFLMSPICMSSKQETTFLNKFISSFNSELFPVYDFLCNL